MVIGSSLPVWRLSPTCTHTIRFHVLCVAKSEKLFRVIAYPSAIPTICWPYAVLGSLVSMAHGPGVRIRRICVNNSNNIPAGPATPAGPADSNNFLNV